MVENEINMNSNSKTNTNTFMINNTQFYKSVFGVYEFILPTRYHIKELIGFGSFGAVVDAYDYVHKRVVAIKKIQNIKDHIDLKRVIREIVILKNLKHDNIINLYDVIFIRS